ncbi:MAG: archaeosine biosynthesis radical SAM protein RaSEA [Candidatus Heimdallarchaeota archaeon]|nr:archaeosine biosynthesis radical SAM protein RaSEA [Candidatus Heimdallarchaeota archaeon]
MKINKSFAERINYIRETELQSRAHSKKIVYWEEDSRLRSEQGKALVFILPTRGCSWALSKSGGCSICGYIYDNPQQTDFDSIYDTFQAILKNKLKKEFAYAIKIFTSGSFLDPLEIPEELQLKFTEELSKYEQIKEIVVESRPEYIKGSTLQKIAKVIDVSILEIAIGLESTNNSILMNSINKGFFWEDFEKATKIVKENGAKVKAYLLFKPPFVSEYDSMRDMLQSVKRIISLEIDTISINAVSIHRGTYLSQLFEKHQYRTPWLWSLFYVCKNIKEHFPNLRLICDIVAGGNMRGAHNCGECDQEVIQAIKNFTMSQNVDSLGEEISCSCKNEWKSNLLHEKISISEQVSQKYM